MVKSGSLFPALRRMQEEGLDQFWLGESPNESAGQSTDRLTKGGRETVGGGKTAKWERIVLGISRTLEAS